MLFHTKGPFSKVSYIYTKYIESSNEVYFFQYTYSNLLVIVNITYLRKFQHVKELPDSYDIYKKYKVQKI